MALLDEAVVATDTGHVAAHNTLHALYNNIIHPNPIDPKPGSPGGFDDEFEGTLTSWTNQYVGTAPTWAINNGKLYFEAPAQAGPQFKTLTKALPSGDWTLTARISATTHLNQGYNKPIGLILKEGTTSQKITYCGIDRYLFSRWYGTGYTSFSAESNVSYQGMQSVPLYLRLIYTSSSTTYEFEVSGNGETFTPIWSTSSLGYTPNGVGLGGTAENSSYPVGATIDWIRET